jgi:hypothetical protein
MERAIRWVSPETPRERVKGGPEWRQRIISGNVRHEQQTSTYVIADLGHRNGDVHQKSPLENASRKWK